MWRTFINSITRFASGYSIWLIIIAAVTGTVGYKSYNMGYAHSQAYHLQREKEAIAQALLDYKETINIGDSTTETITVYVDKIKEVEVEKIVYKDKIITRIEEICSGSTPSSDNDRVFLVEGYNRLVDAANRQSIDAAVPSLRASKE